MGGSQWCLCHPSDPILTIPGPSSCLYPGPPPPWPISFSVLISQSCTRRELSMGGWFFGFCLFVYLFNLMICKVMFLFLFTLFSSYLTSVWKMILVTVHFFLPPNNDNNKLPILCWGRVWCRLFSTDVTDQRIHRDSNTPHTGKAMGCHTHGEHMLTLETQWSVTKQPPTRVAYASFPLVSSRLAAAKWY